MPLSDHARFLGTFVRSPMATGAVAPSSRWLAALMVEGMGLGGASTVVELGPGTGAFTGAILNEIGPQALLLAMEVNPEFARLLAERYPRVRVVNDSAERLPAHLAAHGRARADCILSGLPWAGFPLWLQERLLEAVVTALDPGGRFATFGYVHAAWLPPGRRFRRMLGRSFARVDTTRVVWRNLPPAFVYRCTRQGTLPSPPPAPGGRGGTLQ